MIRITKEQLDVLVKEALNEAMGTNPMVKRRVIAALSLIEQGQGILYAATYEYGDVSREDAAKLTQASIAVGETFDKFGPGVEKISPSLDSELV